MQKSRPQLDPNNLHEVLKTLPRQFLDAWKNTRPFFKEKPKKIICCGLGGSALPADLLINLARISSTKLPKDFLIHRDYELPEKIDKSWTIILISYSGNTEETLSALKEAEKRGLKKIIALSHGGELKKHCLKKGYPLIDLPDTHQPRFAYGYILGALVKICSCFKFKATQIEAELTKVLNEMPRIEKTAIQMAKTLKNRVPIIYSTVNWQEAAKVWKINFNENSKIQAFCNIIPEANHNEMVGFTKLLAKYHLIMLADQHDTDKNLRRMELLAKLFQNIMPATIIDLHGSPLYKMFCCLSLGLLTSYHLAINYQIKPEPVAMVEKFKQLLK